MKKHGKTKLISVIALSVVFVFLATVTGLIYITNFSEEAVKFDPEMFVSVKGGFGVFDVNGKALPESVPIKSSRKTPLKTLPSYVKNAFIAVEDKRFYRHKGVDPIRILGAIKNNILSGRFKEGASTITQQLVKNVYLSGKKNFSRKINEIRLALEVEKHYSKEEILEIYLNTIYFGNNAYGIQSAAQTYFDKNAENLTLSEAAVLAGMIKAPTSYSPGNNLEKCLKRRNIVLSLMKEQNFISRKEYRKATKETIDLSLINRNKSFYKRYMHGAVQEACEILKISEKRLGESNFKIYTYYEEEAQSILEQSAENADVKTICGNPAQRCGIIVDNATFGICAFSGYGQSNFYTMKRNIGSCAKPLAVYAPALNEKLITPATVFSDVRRSYGSYSPRNYGGKYYGMVTVREALARSLNSVAVLLMNELTPSLSRKYLAGFGIETDKNDANLSLALGSLTYGTGFIGLTEAYASLANRGKHSKAVFVRSITDENGRELYRHKPVYNSAIDEDSAFLTTDMLTSAVEYGTAKALNGLKFAVAAKTGTVGHPDSDRNTDALIVSYTKNHTVTVWLGGNGDDLLPSSVTGGSSPATIAREILENLYKNKSKPQDFTPPQSVKRMKVAKNSLAEGRELLLANENEDYIEEYFSLKNLPRNKTNEDPEIFDFSVTIQNGKPYIQIRGNGSYYELHRTEDDKDRVIARLNGKEASFTDDSAESGKTYVYYAIPFYGEERGEPSEKTEIALPTKDYEEEKPHRKWWEWTEN